MSTAALLPTLPNYLLEIGASTSQVGVVMSSFALGVLLFRPLVGKQVDSTGRKIVLIFGTLIYVVSPLLYVFIHSVAALIPVRVFHGLGLAAFGTASITLITDAAAPQQRAEVISYTGMVNTVAFALGPILGSFVGDHWGYPTLFCLIAVTSFSCLLVSLFVKETFAAKISANNQSYLQAIWQRRILLSFVIILLIAVTHGAVMFYLPIFLKENVQVNIGLFFTAFGAATLAVRGFIGRVSDTWGRGPLIVFSLVFMTLGVLALRYSTSVGLMLLAAILYGFGFGSQQPTLTALVADNTTKETRGKIFSFYYGGFDLGISLAGIVLGAAAEHLGIKNMFLICTLITFSGLLIFTLFFEHTVTQSIRCAFALQKDGSKCYICEEYMEVSPKQAEEIFKAE
jgi:MFS family permease